MITLLIIYTIHCILNYYGNLIEGLNTETTYQKVELILTGFFCTPFAILMLFLIFLSKKNIHNSLNHVINDKNIYKISWIFSISFNGLILYLYFR